MKPKTFHGYKNSIVTSVLMLILAISSTYATGKFEPPDGKTLLLIGENQNSVNTYVKEFKTIPAGFMVYTNLDNVTGLSEPFNCGAGVQYGQLIIDKYPDTVIQIGLYMVDMLEGALAGDYDASIDRLGAWIAATKRPVFLRIGYEFDGPHFHYDPEKYVQVYRYYVVKLILNSVIYFIKFFASLVLCKTPG
ncbi:MAG: hypothetical protein ABSH12_09700, partial [Endomicrobiales bacterium]